MSPQEIHSFLLCREAHTEPSHGLVLKGILDHIPIGSPTLTIVVRLYFVVVSDPGTFELHASVRSLSGRVAGTLSTPLEFGVRGCRAGVLPMKLEFSEPGWHVVRAEFGDTVMERLLCVFTPETREEMLKNPPPVP